MDVLRERSAGLDVHRSVIVACVLTSSAGAPVSKAVQSFAATAAGLVGLVSWLRGSAVTPVGMEATGVYWMPVYAALEAAGGLTPIVANAGHIKAVPGHARKKIAPLTTALEGHLAEHQRFVLQMQLHRIEATEQQIAQLDEQIETRRDPYRAQMALLMSIPGIEWGGAATILAEIGVDMSVFPTAGHLAAWAGVCPANNQSAGKQKATAARTANRHATTALCNAAVSAAHRKGSYLKAKYHSLKSRIGAPARPCSQSATSCWSASGTCWPRGVSTAISARATSTAAPNSRPSSDTPASSTRSATPSSPNSRSPQWPPSAQGPQGRSFHSRSAGAAGRVRGRRAAPGSLREPTSPANARGGVEPSRPSEREFS